MAGSRKPGPLGLELELQDLNDGTLIRGLSPRSGPIGMHPVSIAGVHGKPWVAPPQHAGIPSEDSNTAARKPRFRSTEAAAAAQPTFDAVPETRGRWDIRSPYASGGAPIPARCLHRC